MTTPPICPWCHRPVQPNGTGDDLPATADPDDPTSTVMHQGCVVAMHLEAAAGTPERKKRRAH